MQASTIPGPWAILYMLSCFRVSVTFSLENQASQALLYGQKAVAVARAARLQGRSCYAFLFANLLNIYIQLEYKAGSGARHGEHATPYEGFIAAVAVVKQMALTSSKMLAMIDSFIQEHTRCVEEMQAELVRYEGPASFHLYCSDL